MSDVQIIEAGSDITPGTGGQTEHEAREAEEKGLRELQDAAFEAEQTILKYRAARLKFVRKTFDFPKGDLLDKDPSPLHESLAMYIGEKTGHHVDSEVVKIVQLTLALHGEHQASNEWKAKKAALESARAAERAALKAQKTVRTETRVAKAVDKVEEAFQVGIKMLEAGVKLPDSVMVGLRAHAEAQGITLPGDEPKPEANPEVAPETSSEEQALNSEAEAKPKPSTSPRRTPKTKPAKADA
jgi:hypothetical protein